MKVDSSHDAIISQRIKQFNEMLMTQEIEKTPIGLFNGLMGICIYFYHQAHFYQEKRYRMFAGKLLDAIINKLTNIMSIDLQNGLIGICFGLNYLMNNNFVRCNSNTILQEPEDKIYRDVYTVLNNNQLNSDAIQALLHVSFYFCLRLEDQKLPLNERFLYQDLIMTCINQIEIASFSDQYTEHFVFFPISYFLPLYLIVLSKVYQLGFYNYRIEKIWDILHETLLTTYPYLQCHRIFFALSMKEANNFHKSVEWEKHITMLLNNSNLSYIIDSEFLNKNILPHNGLTGFYYILRQYRCLTNSDKSHFARKIAQSVLWEKMPNTQNNVPFGLVSGLAGVILAYQDCSNIEITQV